MFSDCYTIRNGLPEFRMFIGGKWVRSKKGRTLPVDSPIDDSVIARVQAGSKDDMDRAIEAAYRARKAIRDIPAIERIDILNKARHMIEDNREDFTDPDP
jgi:glyceraldehyde-3-phosphate dehydrogenase (NADP+)